jgi:hypothetical protein
VDVVTRSKPRDPALGEQMKQVAPDISRQTTMWLAWIGFNASHSLGSMLFGLVYGYLALTQYQFLAQAKFHLVLGVLFPARLVLLAKRFWFSIPFFGTRSATVLFVFSAALALALV